MNVHFPEADLEVCFQTLCNAAGVLEEVDPSDVTIVGNEDPEHARAALKEAALDFVRELVAVSILNPPDEFTDETWYLAAHQALGVLDRLERFL